MADGAPIIVKRIKKVGHGHHGGAWKVAYADFVTAMMAFFLLLWLLNTTTPEQKRGIADYFAPANVSLSTSGSGGILGGTVVGENGALSGGAVAVVERETPPDRPAKGEADAGTNAGQAGSGAPVTDDEIDRALAEREQQAFQQAEMSLRQAMQDLPDLAELSKHLLIDQTPEGLRIQLVDQDGRPMFDPGSSDPNPRTRRLLEEVSKVIERLPNRISVSGHTDAAPFQRDDGFTNWDLSAARANAARRILTEHAVPAARVFQVSGKAGSEPLYPDDPYASANRRISIVLMREAPPLPPGHQP